MNLCSSEFPSSDEGDDLPNFTPSDIVFVIQEKPHALFKRHGSHLLHEVKVTLKQVRHASLAHAHTPLRRTMPGTDRVRCRSHGYRYARSYPVSSPAET